MLLKLKGTVLKLMEQNMPKVSLPVLIKGLISMLKILG